MIRFLRRLVEAARWRFRCHWAALRARSDSQRALEAGPVRQVHVVCYGNIYRSPYAAALLRRMLAGRAEVTSSGFHQVVGRQSPKPITDLAAARGVELASHRSSLATAADLGRADLIVVMDRHNWQAVRRLAPGIRRIVWLGSMDGRGELRDPYGRGEAELRAVVDRLHRSTEILAEKISALHRSARD